MKVEKKYKYILTLTFEEAKILKEALYYEFNSWTREEHHKKLLRLIYQSIDIEMTEKEGE